MLRQGAFPEPPEELQGMDIDIEYVSPLAKSQKMAELQSTLRGIEVLSQFGEMAPVMDYLDGDRMIQYLVDVLGLPARVIRSSEEVAILRRQQQQQAQQQQAADQQAANAEQAGQIAPYIKATGEIPQI